MNKLMKVHGIMSMLSGMQIPPNNTEFPANPGLGQVHSAGNSIYVFTEINGFQTWFPLVRGSDTATYLHTQALAKLVWQVDHQLDADDVWFIVKDSNGNFETPYSVEQDQTDPRNKLIVTFVEPIAGTMFVVGSKAFSSSRINASVITIGGSFELNSSGINIDGKVIDLANIPTLTDVNNLVASKVNIGDIVDSLVSNSSGVPLSANQGRVLNNTKVNIADIIDNLTTNDTKKPLSANQGAVLAAMISAEVANRNNAIVQALTGYQTKLASGTSIKTVNGQSLLGSGDLTIAGGGGGNVSGSQAATIHAGFDGPVTPVIGTKRRYIRADCTITNIFAWLNGNAGSAVSAAVNVNGVRVATISISTGSFSASLGVNIDLKANDYLTIDVLGGTGSDLQLRLDY